MKLPCCLAHPPLFAVSTETGDDRYAHRCKQGVHRYFDRLDERGDLGRQRQRHEQGEPCIWRSVLQAIDTIEPMVS